MTTTTRAAPRSISWYLRVLGAGLLFATGGIHLDLYLTGYRHIPTIGPLFLLQVIVAFALAVWVLALASRLVISSAAFFPLSTLGGYILSLWIGLFGFNEVRTTAGVVAGIIDVAAFAALAAAVLTMSTTPSPSEERIVRLAKPLAAPIAGLGLLALILAAINAQGPGATSPVTSASGPGGGSGGEEVMVRIVNFAFVPAHVVAHPGERIVVKNADSVAHTFTAMPNSTPAASFTTGSINPAASATTTAPSVAGTYHFYCAIHPFMTGTLTVSS